MLQPARSDGLEGKWLRGGLRPHNRLLGAISCHRADTVQEGRASTKIAAAYMMQKQIQLCKSTIVAVVKIQSIQR